LGHPDESIFARGIQGKIIRPKALPSISISTYNVALFRMCLPKVLARKTHRQY
jgi:hypothetical protein